MSQPPVLRQPPEDRIEASLAIRGAELVGGIWRRTPSLVMAARGRLLRRGAQQAFRRQPRPLQLCLGSGRAPIPGWTNVDYYFPADVRLDLRYGIPVPDDSVDLIYSEHLFEHLPLDASLKLFRECRRILAPGGRMRIATPDLGDIVRDYQNDWRRHDWVNWDEYRMIDSGTRMLNVAVREWGHVYLWDYEELARRLAEAGFDNLSRHQVGESGAPELRGLETRADSRLIVEAQPRKATR